MKQVTFYVTFLRVKDKTKGVVYTRSISLQDVFAPNASAKKHFLA